MWPNPQETADLVTFTEETLMEKFIFCAVLVTLSYPLSFWKTQVKFSKGKRFF